MSEKTDFTDWNYGPDELFPAQSYISTNIKQPVKIRTYENDKLKPVSIYTVFKKTVEKLPKHIAFVNKVNGVSKEVSYETYWSLCNKAAKSFIKLDVKVNTCVAILGFNAPAWMISLYGTIFSGAVACGIYTTNGADACEYILKDSGCEVIVVENKQHLDKILSLKTKCKIRAIIQYSDNVTDNHNGLIKTWDEFLEYGSSVSDEALRNRIKTIAPNKCASLIYTSGTTGNPKAAMLSHDNICTNCAFVVKHGNLKFAEERLISFLPLSHIAAQLVDCFISVYGGATLYFAQPDALKGTLINTLIEAKPTAFFGVPRVWEKLEERIEVALNNQSKTKLRILKWAQRNSTLFIQAKFNNQSNKRLQYFIADKLILNKIKKKLGLNKCRIMSSGAAPISKKTLDFFISLGVPLCEVYGLSESTGPQAFGIPTNNRIASVGNSQTDNSRTKIEKDQDGNGEICLSGRNIFMGYLNSESKTKEAIDEDGWLHTGDIGRIDKDGFLFITGRIKELIITAGGENIAPVPIEENIQGELPICISNCMLVGDKRKFLTILITLKCKVNLDTLEPMDELTDAFIKWLKENGCSNITKVSQILSQKEKLVYSTIESAIKKANTKAISRATVVQKFEILPKDFSMLTGELGPTLKLRRQIVLGKYSDIIERMYKDDKE